MGKVEGAQKTKVIAARLPTIECKGKGAQVKDDGDKHWWCTMKASSFTA